MNVRNCKMCGRLFNYIAGAPVCPACKEELENKFQEVKKYIQDNRNVSVKQVSEECDVDEALIRQWVREERLIFAEGSVSGICCEKCGAAIMTGKYCDRCKNDMISTLSNAGRRPVHEQPKVQKTTHENKMRFLNN